MAEYHSLPRKSAVVYRCPRVRFVFFLFVKTYISIRNEVALARKPKKVRGRDGKAKKWRRRVQVFNSSKHHISCIAYYRGKGLL